MKSSKVFDGLMFAWGMAMVMVYISQGAPLAVTYDAELGDTVAQPTCEVCKSIDPDSILIWLCQLLNCLS